MSMLNQPDVGAWIDKAEMDRTVCRLLLRQGNDHCWEAVCFHSQQVAEKYMKAVWQAQGIEIEKTHKLPQLALRLGAVLPELNQWKEELAWLSEFAVDIRYPIASGLATTREHAERAIKIAEQIKDICLHHLKGEVQ